MPLMFPGGLDQASPRVQWADWLELWLLYAQGETLSREEMREALELLFPEEELLDTMVDEAFAEVRSRQALLKASYPICHRGTHLKRVRPRQECLVFSFLVALNAHQFYEETRLDDAAWQEPARLFEYVVTAALQRYLNGRAIRIGTPREDPVPVNFADCLKYLEREMQELAMRPLNPHVGAGDEDCDVVGWAPFVDGKPGQLIVLAQCGIGERWKTKLDSLRLDVWRHQFDWHAEPIKAFAVPFLPGDDPDEWHYICVKGGVHFDRLRLISLVGDEDLDGGIVARIRAWCDGFAGRLPYTE